MYAAYPKYDGYFAMTYKTELWFFFKLLVLAKSNNVHSWLFWLKEIKNGVWKIQSKGQSKTHLYWALECVFILIWWWVSLRFWEFIRTNVATPLCPPLENLGSRKTPHLSSSYLLPHYWYFCFANLAPPSTNTPLHFHFNILPHLIPGYLGFKVMLYVQSKQKTVEYQQSFIKQLMDLHSPEEPMLGCWTGRARHHARTQWDVSLTAFFSKLEPGRTQNNHV